MERPDRTPTLGASVGTGPGISGAAGPQSAPPVRGLPDNNNNNNHPQPPPPQPRERRPSTAASSGPPPPTMPLPPLPNSRNGAPPPPLPNGPVSTSSTSMTSVQVISLVREVVRNALESEGQGVEAGGVGPGLKSGITIDLSRRGIQKLPDEVIDLVKNELERLALSHNQLSSLPARFGECTALRYLNIRGNQIKEFPMALFRNSRSRPKSAPYAALRAVKTFISEGSVNTQEPNTRAPSQYSGHGLVAGDQI
ncbi:hypothetical protein PT974_00352 [Cladobotryum mycophilum]|uniref:Uncharacterized protein n=1 Tax=Cladobotryum mycophilum TaxID=491253 RepID=A0ABR0T0U7_9HYPO